MFFKMKELVHYSAQTKRGPAGMLDILVLQGICSSSDLARQTTISAINAFQYFFLVVLESLASFSQLLRDKHALMRAKQMTGSPSMSAASVLPMGASTPIQPASQIMTVNNGGPNPSHIRGSASPRAIKRRTSVGISPGDTALRDSPALDDSQVAVTGGAGTPMSLQASTLVGVGPSTSGVVTGLGLNLIGSPVPSPLSAVTSPVFVSSNTAGNPAGTVPPSAKTAKRIRTASATPTLAAATPNGTKGSASNGTTTARNRKGAGRKDSSAKRKASMTDISDATATPGAGSVGAQDLDAGLTPNLSAVAAGSSVGHSMGVSGPNGPALHGPSSQLQQTPFHATGSYSFNAGVMKGAAINGPAVFMDGGPIPASPMNGHTVSDGHAYVSAGNRPNGAMLADQRNGFQAGTDILTNYGSPSGQDFSGLGNGGLSLGMMTGFGQDMPPLQAQAQAQAHMQGQHMQVGQHTVQGLGQVQGPQSIGYGAAAYGGQTGQSMGLGVNGMMGSMEGMAAIPPNATLLTSNSGLHPGTG